LEGGLPDFWFRLLNESLYLTGFPKPEDAYHRMDFLTNASEALNSVKGFLVSPVDEPLHALLQFSCSEVIHHYIIPRSDFCSVSTQFATWVTQQEHKFL
jgi:hypothetical protein